MRAPLSHAADCARCLGRPVRALLMRALLVRRLAVERLLSLAPPGCDKLGEPDSLPDSAGR